MLIDLIESDSSSLHFGSLFPDVQLELTLSCFRVNQPIPRSTQLIESTRHVYPSAGRLNRIARNLSEPQGLLTVGHGKFRAQCIVVEHTKLVLKRQTIIDRAVLA